MSYNIVITNYNMRKLTLYFSKFKIKLFCIRKHILIIIFQYLSILIDYLLSHFYNMLRMLFHVTRRS